MPENFPNGCWQLRALTYPSSERKGMLGPGLLIHSRFGFRIGICMLLDDSIFPGLVLGLEITCCKTTNAHDGQG